MNCFKPTHKQILPTGKVSSIELRLIEVLDNVALVEASDLSKFLIYRTSITPIKESKS